MSEPTPTEPSQPLLNPQAIGDRTDSLERQLRERILELQEANDRLQCEIAERRQAEEALRESEHTYRILFENMTSGFALHEIIYDEQGRPADYRFLEMNPAFERLTDVPIKRSLGKTLKEVLPGLEQYWIDVYGKVAQTGEPAAYQNFAGVLNRYYDIWAFSPAKNLLAVILTDITNRKRAEKALRQSEDLLQRILQSSSDCIIAWDKDFKCLYANESACRHVGKTQAEVLGRSIDEARGHLTDLMELWKGRIREVIRTGQGMRVEDKTLVNGEPVYSESVLSPILDADGHASALTVVYRDMTQQKLAEEKLRASETRYRMLVENSLVGVAQIAADGRTVYANPAMLSMREANCIEEIAGRRFSSLFTPESREVVDRELEKRRQGTSSTYEGEIAGLRGGRRNVVICGAPLLSTTRESMGSIGSVLDVTERNRAEEALRNSESHYRMLFESANDAIFVVKNGAFSDCNPAATRVFGRSREELLGHFVGEFSPARQPDGRDSREVARERSQAVLEGRPQFFTGTYLRGDGAALLAEVSLNRMDTASGPTVLAIVRDVTERKRAEESLRKSEREKEAILDGLKDVIVTFFDRDLHVIWSKGDPAKTFGSSSAKESSRFCNEIAADCVALKAIQSGQPQEDELAIPGGPTMLVRANPIKDANAQAVVGVVHVAVDITERKLAEERLKHMQSQLAHVARLSTVGELAAEIAHELSQPLYAILNYAKASRNQLAMEESPNLEGLRRIN